MATIEKSMLKKRFYILSMVCFLTACSAIGLKQTAESKKIQFEQMFAEQCVKKEISNSVNPDVDRLRFSKPCLCIAKRIGKELSERERERFLFKQKITRSLAMRFDKAAYFCVQSVTRPKSKFSVRKKQ